MRRIYSCPDGSLYFLKNEYSAAAEDCKECYQGEKMIEINKIIGKKIVGIKGFVLDRRIKKGINPRFILFNDGKTFIELEEQEYSYYHDCSSKARRIRVCTDEERWKLIKTDKCYPEANTDI